MQTLQLNEVLSKFQPHGLKDLNRAELMNRVDSKFLIPQAILPEILDQLADDFSILEIGEKRLFLYQSIYFDTPKLQFYFSHHGGRLNRHKVRVRRYVDSETQFLEVKFKNNKKRTIKNRIEIDFEKVDDLTHHREFLKSLNVPNADILVPVLKNQYHRIQLASESRGERLTIDLNLSNQNLDGESDSVNLHQLAIAELKQSQVDRSSPFYQLLREYNVRPSSFSKYCMGLTLTQKGNDLKCNRFKPILRKLNNLSNKHLNELEVC